jgi:hypothetical protein
MQSSSPSISPWSEIPLQPLRTCTDLREITWKSPLGVEGLQDAITAGQAAALPDRKATKGSLVSGHASHVFCYSESS